MFTCPYCDSETSLDYNLCESCLKQVKCANKSCGALLRPNKPKCLMCGTPILETQQVEPTMNRYVRNISSTSKSYTEHVEVIASDTAIGSFAPLMLNNEQGHPRPRPHSPTIRVNTQPQPQLPFSSEIEPETSTEALSPDAVPDALPNAAPSSQQSKLDENQATALEFFEASGDELTPTIVDFKGPTRKDQLIRFLITY